MFRQTDENLTEIFKALSHPLRQDIITILADHQEIEGIGFTALQNILNLNSSNKKPIQVGTIYHHIGLLGELVHQNKSSKSWMLSERGWFAFNLLTSSQDRNDFLKQGELKRTSPISLIWRYLAPPELFLYAKKSIGLFAGWQILFFLFFAFITSQADLVLISLFFSDLNPNKDIFLSFVSILISWAIFVGLIVILSMLFLRNKYFDLKDITTLAIFLGISLLPLGVFPLLLIIRVFDLNQPYIPLVIAIVLQLWVILLSARAISVQFFVRMEKAGIISIISIYIMVLLGLILRF